MSEIRYESGKSGKAVFYECCDYNIVLNCGNHGKMVEFGRNYCWLIDLVDISYGNDVCTMFDMERAWWARCINLEFWKRGSSAPEGRCVEPESFVVK